MHCGKDDRESATKAKKYLFAKGEGYEEDITYALLELSRVKEELVVLKLATNSLVTTRMSGKAANTQEP